MWIAVERGEGWVEGAEHQLIVKGFWIMELIKISSEREKFQCLSLFRTGGSALSVVTLRWLSG